MIPRSQEYVWARVSIRRTLISDWNVESFDDNMNPYHNWSDEDLSRHAGSDPRSRWELSLQDPIEIEFHESGEIDEGNLADDVELAEELKRVVIEDTIAGGDLLADIINDGVLED
jgi:hypothetical protein